MVLVKTQHNPSPDHHPTTRLSPSRQQQLLHPEPAPVHQYVLQASESLEQLRHSPLPPQLTAMNANGRAVLDQKMPALNGGGQNGTNGFHDGNRGRAPVSSNHRAAASYPSKVTTAPTTTAPTTAVARQTTSNTIAAPLGEPAELLRQTLQSAPNSRPGSRSSSRRRPPPTPTTPKSTIYTPNGSAENSEGEGPHYDIGETDFHRMRHGFEDEYNSEDYLAVLEQVSVQFLSHQGVSTHAGTIGFLHVLHGQATRIWRKSQSGVTVSAPGMANARPTEDGLCSPGFVPEYRRRPTWYVFRGSSSRST
jgi:hypothetical protein